MKIKTATLIKIFGDQVQVAKFFNNCTKQAVNQWGEYIPELRALQLEKRRPDIADAINQGEYDE